MEIVRYLDKTDDTVAVGVHGDDGIAPVPVADLAELWSQPASELPLILERTGPSRRRDEVVLLPPIDGQTEVWAAGVTYERSRGA